MIVMFAIMSLTTCSMVLFLERKGKTLWTENESGDVVTCHCEESAREEAGWVAHQIKDVLKENPNYHIAVLYRTNFLSRNFEDVLTEQGITRFDVIDFLHFYLLGRTAHMQMPAQINE